MNEQTTTLTIAAMRIERVVRRGKATDDATFNLLGYGDPWQLCRAVRRHRNGEVSILISVCNIVPGQSVALCTAIQMATNWLACESLTQPGEGQP